MDLSLFKSIEPEEMALMLKKAASFGGKVELPTLTSNREFEILNIVLDNMGMLRLDLADEFYSEDERHIKISLKYRKMFFHLMPGQYIVEGKTLVAHLPLKAKALTIRNTDRYVMAPTTNISTLLHRVEKRGGNCDVSATIYDVSHSGIAFLLQNVDEDNDIILRENDHIWIRAINSYNLETPLFGRIVYATNKKIGVSLGSQIPNDIFKKLQEMSSMLLTA